MQYKLPVKCRQRAAAFHSGSFTFNLDPREAHESESDLETDVLFFDVHLFLPPPLCSSFILLFIKIPLIPGVGTRDYYRKLGYELDGPCELMSMSWFITEWSEPRRSRFPFGLNFPRPCFPNLACLWEPS